MCQALVPRCRLLLKLLVHRGQAEPQHRGCRMLPPALTPQLRCQEQHQLGAGIESPSQSGLNGGVGVC